MLLRTRPRRRVSGRCLPAAGSCGRCALEVQGVLDITPITTTIHRNLEEKRGIRKMGKLDGKTALVTGAGRGLGRAIAKGLAAQGAAVLVNDFGVTLAGEKESSSPADQVAAEINAAGGKAAVNYGNVAKWADAEAMVQQAVKE